MNTRNLICHIHVVIYLLVPFSEFAAADQAVITAVSEQAHSELIEIADDLDFAWDMAFLPNGQLVLSEYDGRLRLFDRNQDRTGIDLKLTGLSFECAAIHRTLCRGGIAGCYRCEDAGSDSRSGFRVN